MLVDLHTHTMPLSMDSGLAVDRLVSLAKQRGLDGVCLTEHNAVWEPTELADLRKKHDLAIFSGMEVGTDNGHVLVFGLERFTPELVSLARLQGEVELAGGAMVLAHPLREGSLTMEWREVASVFDGVEVLNGSDANSSNAYLVSLAQAVGLPGTGGSDAHSPGVIGTCATRFRRRVQNDADLVQELRAGRFAAINLRQPPSTVEGLQAP